MKYTRYLVLLLFLAIPVVLHAEPVDYDYQEPTEPGTLSHTTVWWCKAKTLSNSGCLVWRRLEPDIDSDDGNGNDVKTLNDIEIPLDPSELPVYVHVCATATDINGNASNRGACVAHQFGSTAPPNDVTPPSSVVMTLPGLVGSAPYYNDGTVPWTATCTDNEACTQCQLRADGTPVGTVDTNGGDGWGGTWTTGYSVDTSDALDVICEDAEANSTHSADQTVTIDVTAPGVTVDEFVDDTLGGTINFAGSASDTSSGVASVQFRLNGTLIGSPDTSSPYTLTGYNSTASTDGSYDVTATGIDNVGNSGLSTSSVVLVIDNTDPSTPTDLVATVSTIEPLSRINLNWTGSTDALTEIDLYNVYMCQPAASCTPTFVGSTEVIGYAATGLIEATAYKFQVSAVDGAGNESTLSTSDTESTGSSAGDITSNLALHLPFDNNLTDSSTSGITVTGIGSPTFTAGTVGTHAVSLNGTTQGIDAGTSTLPDMGTGDYTVSVWVKAQDPPSTYGLLLYNGGNSSSEDGIYWGINGSTGFLELYVSNGTSYVVNGFTDNFDLRDNAWHHIVWLWDRDVGLKYYIDNVEAHTAATTNASNIITDLTFSISPTAQGFSGLLDDYRVYKRALDSTARQALFDMGEAVDPPPPTGNAFYISPTGNNANPGTTGSPWGTFTFALAQLEPGDTLFLKNGTYNTGNTGKIVINNLHGAAGSPITIKAENERQAHVVDNGSNTAIYANNSSYLTFEGIRATSADLSSSTSNGEPVQIWNSTNIEFKRMLITNNNRYCNCHLLDILFSSDILIEDTELYYFHRHAIALWFTDDTTIRRSYCNSRGHADIGGGYPSHAVSSNRGDSCIAFYPSNDSIVENTISEGNEYLIEVNGQDVNIGNRVLGSISRADLYGAIQNSRAPDLQHMVRDLTFENFSVISPDLVGLYARAGKNVQCNKCTVLNPGLSGYIADGGDAAAGWVGDGNPTFFATNSLVLGADAYGYRMIDQAAFGINFPNSTGNLVNYDPASSHASITNENTTSPALGSCLVWIPTASPMKGAGLSGADIGANILYKYVNGVLTGDRLWDITTSNFAGCGATVSGVNDTTGNSCINVDDRLNINKNGCSFPTGY